MAASGEVEAILTGITDPVTQRVLKAVFRYVLSNLRFGRATGSTGQSAASSAVPSENFGGGFVTGTTSAVANREFAIPHRIGSAPYVCVPFLPLDQVGASLVRLTVSRAADASNVYLKSPDISQPVFLYLEG